MIYNCITSYKMLSDHPPLKFKSVKYYEMLYNAMKCYFVADSRHVLLGASRVQRTKCQAGQILYIATDFQATKRYNRTH